MATGSSTSTPATVTTATGPVKFGIGQITHPTPQMAKNLFRVVLYAAVIVNIIILNVPQIPDPVKVQILAYVNIGTGLVHSFSKLFGIDISDITPPTT